jgi:UDP-glucose 4-epimerase
MIAADVRDESRLRQIFSSEAITAVIHFAALKAVSESVTEPLSYYANNVGGLISLLEAMKATGVRSLVFSSSATVYGEPRKLPIDETQPTSSISPYGRTKLMCENILADLAASNAAWRISILRYFNPVGAHSSGLIGEDPMGIPNNLFPLMLRAANGRYKPLSIFGTDYPTKDGTAIRDYVHVQDVAEGHVAALTKLDHGDPYQVYNLGTGRGTSVLELVAAFEAATGVGVPTVFAPPRAGDVPALFADATKAERQLGWKASRTLSEACADSWRFACRQYHSEEVAVPSS